MRQVTTVFLLSCVCSFSGPFAVFGQENCSTPIVIANGSGGETQVDLANFGNDYDMFCELPTSGPDIVFLADGSNVDFVFRVTNEGPMISYLFLLFTFWCDPDISCDQVFYIGPWPTGVTMTFSPTISQPYYVIVIGPPSTPSIPLRFNYSLGVATPVQLSTWGMIKSMYAE